MYDLQEEPVFRVVPRFIGTMDESRPVLAPLRSFGKPMDDLRELSYCESQRFLDPGARWGLRSLWRTRTLQTFEPSAIEVLADRIKHAPSPRCMVIVEQLSGEVSRMPPDACAVGFRSAAFNLMMVAQWENPADGVNSEEWVKDLAARLASLPDSGAYVNYLAADATEEDVIRAYGIEKYDALRRIKQEYDPDNVFRCNQNISPARHDH